MLSSIHQRTWVERTNCASSNSRTRPEPEDPLPCCLSCGFSCTGLHFHAPLWILHVCNNLQVSNIKTWGIFMLPRKSLARAYWWSEFIAGFSKARTLLKIFSRRISSSSSEMILVSHFLNFLKDLLISRVSIRSQSRLGLSADLCFLASHLMILRSSLITGESRAR